MSFDFPASPSLNQEFTPSGGPTYAWDGSAWKQADKWVRYDTTRQITAGYTHKLYDWGYAPRNLYLDPKLGQFQRCINQGDFNITAPSVACTMILDIMMSANAGTVGTGAFTLVDGDLFSLTNGNVFRCYVSVNGLTVRSHMSIKRMV